MMEAERSALKKDYTTWYTTVNNYFKQSFKFFDEVNQLEFNNLSI